MLTAFATIESAIEAVAAGASDYLSKPFRMEEIKIVVRRTLDARRLTRENLQFRQELKARYGFETLVGQSHQMVEIYKLIARVASLETTVLIQGETGTGKELVARAIHGASARASHPFVVVDCAALPETLFESELFATSVARSPARSPRGEACSRRRPAAPASSTRSESSPHRSRPSSPDAPGTHDPPRWRQRLDPGGRPGRGRHEP